MVVYGLKELGAKFCLSGNDISPMIQSFIEAFFGGVRGDAQEEDIQDY